MFLCSVTKPILFYLKDKVPKSVSGLIKVIKKMIMSVRCYVLLFCKSLLHKNTGILSLDKTQRPLAYVVVSIQNTHAFRHRWKKKF
jgi:hypothetical protein